MRVGAWPPYAAACVLRPQGSVITCRWVGRGSHERLGMGSLVPFPWPPHTATCLLRLPGSGITPAIALVRSLLALADAGATALPALTLVMRPGQRGAPK